MINSLAERVGFEPTVHFSAYTHLAGEHLQPLGHLSILIAILAEGVGFEPTVPLDTAVFKTAALNHSAIPPERDQLWHRIFIVL